MRRTFTRFMVLAILCSFAIQARAQQKQLTIDDIYDPEKKIEFGGTPPTGLIWLQDGRHYLQRKLDPKTRTGDLLKVDALTGASEPFFDAAKMEAAFVKLPGITAADAKRLAHRGIYQMNAAQTATLINFASDLFYYEFGGDAAIRLTNTADEEVGEEFSPDGRMVSYIRNYNLYVVDVATQRERSLTKDGNSNLFYGRLDWVYQEELYGRGNFKGYWWSPDSSEIVYLRLDESKVKNFIVVDHIPREQKIEDEKYPLAGDPNPVASLGIVRVAGGETRWIDNFKYEGADFLIVRVDWTPDSKKVVYQVQNREQTWLDLNFADSRSGKVETILHESSKAWVQVNDNPHWLNDGSFLWESERSGWNHLYHYGADGKLLKQVTSGAWEVRGFNGVDESKGLVYFSSSEHSQIGNHVYRINLDGSGLTRLTQTEGSHQGNFNPSFTHFIDTWSDAATPPQVRLLAMDGTVARVIDANDQTKTLGPFQLSKPEFLQVKTRDGFVMEVMLIKPVHFDPKKKYPVFSHTYSGPHAPQVRDGWGGATGMWYQFLAERGYIVWVCDNRTASGKGAESTWPVYRNFGELELRDLEDGLNWLKSQPFVDGSRIALEGWSYGGFMTSYALTHSKSFKIGIAGGTVADWRLYDSIYTERYMAMPQNNADGYSKSSPVHAAKDLHGKLLLLHGAIDDNVHMQNTIQFIYELQKAGKDFQLMVYPKSRHGVVDPVLAKHLRIVVTNFILENL